MVDAPCSGEGMFRKDPVALEEWQKHLISVRSGKRHFGTSRCDAKTGGQLIYSTCTFAPEENEAMMAWLMEEYPSRSKRSTWTMYLMGAGSGELHLGLRKPSAYGRI